MKSLKVLLIVVLALVACVAGSVFFDGCSQKAANPVAPSRDNPGNPTIIDNGQVDTTATRPQIPNVALRLASDTRQAMQQECWYALNQNVWNTHARPANDVSNWGYMSNDKNAYHWIKGKMGMYASHWIIGSDPSTYYAYWKNYYSPVYTPCSFYQQVDTYACYAGQGRGMQCRSFARLVPFRSGVYQSDWFPSYAEAINNYYGSRSYTKPISQCRVGDIIQTTWSNGHTAIVVRIVSGVEGQSVTAVEVVDSNWMGDEVIGRHILYSGGGGVGSLSSYLAIDIIALGGH